MATKSKRSILIINPNTTQAMTDGLRPLVDSLGFNDVGLTIRSSSNARNVPG